jgi:hypothetical protein
MERGKNGKRKELTNGRKDKQWGKKTGKNTSGIRNGVRKETNKGKETRRGRIKINEIKNKVTRNKERV